jgi:flavodoxin
MKTAIIYKSIHHGNTKKIAEVMASSLEAELLDLKDVNKDIIKKYDLIGFGSGIYYGKPHKKFMNFIEGFDNADNKKAFVFTTSGRGKPNKWLKENLLDKGFDVIGEFHCKGYDTYGLTKIVGGISKGKPDEEDLKNAEKFAMDLKGKY